MYAVLLTDPATGQTYNLSDRQLSLSVNEQLDRDVTTFSITCKNIYETHLWHHIQILRDGDLWLSGIVLNQRDEDGGCLYYKVTIFDCEDWGHLLNKRIVAKTYLSTDSFGGRPDLIIKDIINISLPEFTTNNIKACASTIEKLQFSYIPSKEAIENVLDTLTGWHYYIDKDKDFHFFQGHESTHDTTFTINHIAVKSLRVEYTGDEHCNKVWIVGKKQETPTAIDQYFTGDGVQRYFSLAYEPNSTIIYVNGVEKDSSLEANDDGNQDFLIDKTRKVIYTPAYRTPFTGTIRVNYKPTKQFIDVYENTADIKTFGLMEKAVKNSDVTNKLSARAYGLAEVKKSSTTKRKVSFKSRTEVAVGQRIALDIQSEYWDIQGYFLVTAVKRSITPEDEIINFELIEI